MPPFLLYGLGALAFLAFRKNQTAPLSKSAPTPQTTGPGGTSAQGPVVDTRTASQKHEDAILQNVTVKLDEIVLADGLTGDGGALGGPANTTAQDVGGVIDTAGKDSKSVPGIVGAIGGALASGAAIGKAADKVLLGGDSSPLTQTTAEIGGAVLLAVGTMWVLTSWMAFPVGPIIAAVVIIVYSVIAIINDFEALSYGQGGAIRDWEKLWNQLHDDCFHKLRIAPEYAAISDKDVERALIPFVDGYLRELNWLAFQRWMKTPRGVPEIGLDTAGHALHGASRGHFVGTFAPMTASGTLVFDERKMLHSWAEDFAVRFCPPDEQTTEEVPL